MLVASMNDTLSDLTSQEKEILFSEHSSEYLSKTIYFPKERQPIMCREAETQTFDRMEWQANVMASCLLMPRELVRKTMQEFGLEKKSRQVNKIYLASDYSKLLRMAEKLGVSKTALSIRLNQLGLMDRYFFTPNSNVEILPTKEEIAMEALWLE